MKVEWVITSASCRSGERLTGVPFQSADGSPILPKKGDHLWVEGESMDVSDVVWHYPGGLLAPPSRVQVVCQVGLRLIEPGEGT